jgi:hypothetical protein
MAANVAMGKGAVCSGGCVDIGGTALDSTGAVVSVPLGVAVHAARVLTSVTTMTLPVLDHAAFLLVVDA